MILGTNTIQENIREFMATEDREVAIEKLNNAFSELEKQIKADAELYAQTGDKEILAQRGYRQLTSAEERYYNKLIEASKMRNVQMAVTTLSDLNDVEKMPETVLDQIFTDIVEDHPLLAKVNFQNARYSTKIIMNDHDQQLAVWGEIEGGISKEITSAFKMIDFQQNKLTAYAMIPLGLLDMGATFLDAYIRRILADAIASALEKAIIEGTGKNEPIGLINKLSGDSGGVFPAKETIKVTDFGVKSMGDLIAKMSVNEKGHHRKVTGLTLIVNSKDYYTLVAPAVRVQNVNGVYVDNFAYPIDIVISEFVGEGKAVLCMLDRYFAGMGFPKDGVIEFSDEYKFLEDQRTYKIKTYGTGRAMDENDALYLDISGLEEAVIATKVKGTVTTKAQA